MDTLTRERQDTMSKDLPDDEIVVQYLAGGDDRLFRILVERHHRRLYSRFLSEVKNSADATDMEQQLWLKVFRNLKTYKREGKFAEYLSRIASNLITDYWRSRGRSRAVFVEQQPARGADSTDGNPSENYSASQVASNETPAADALDSADLVRHLVSVLIPDLPAEQRLAWLLRHESEYWEPAQRLDWCHLSELNGITEDKAWAMFESARNKLLSVATHAGREKVTVDNEEILIFMVWSQAQRLHKEEHFTWEYFAQLLNVPVNTMKTRYRAAQKSLSEGLKAKTQGCPAS
ncbi:MAG: sigma-70 family RNA polymerase sigma factor [Granulosicoccus sp.]